MFDIAKRTELKWARVFNEVACGFMTSGHTLNAVLTYQKSIHPEPGHIHFWPDCSVY